MARRAGHSYWFLLITLAAIWGASYLFIKVAVRDLEPTGVVGRPARQAAGAPARGR